MENWFALLKKIEISENRPKQNCRLSGLATHISNMKWDLSCGNTYHTYHTYLMNFLPRVKGIRSSHNSHIEHVVCIQWHELTCIFSKIQFLFNVATKMSISWTEVIHYTTEYNVRFSISSNAIERD